MQTPLWTEGMTHACENIILPQTSFAGANNEIEVFYESLLPSSLIADFEDKTPLKIVLGRFVDSSNFFVYGTS